MRTRLVRWLIAPLVAVVVTAGITTSQATAAPQEAPQHTVQAPASNDLARQLNALVQAIAARDHISYQQASINLGRFLASLSLPRMSGPCAQWWPLAHDVGWTYNEFKSMQRIMQRESHCNPSVRSVHGTGCCYGLFQIHYMHVLHQPGCPSRNYCTVLYIPRENLRVALALLHGSGRSPWACTRASGCKHH